MVLYDNVKVKTGVNKFVSGSVSVKLQVVNPFPAFVTSYDIHGEGFLICQRNATRHPDQIETPFMDAQERLKVLENEHFQLA